MFFGAFFLEGGADFLAGVLVCVLAFADALGPKASPQLLVYFFVAPIRMMVTVVLLVVFGHDATAKRGATRAAANQRLNQPRINTSISTSRDALGQAVNGEVVCRGHRLVRCIAQEL